MGHSKNEPFESGIVSTGDTRLRFSAKLYLVAMLLATFDVEALLLFAWAISLCESGWPGFIEAPVFIMLLLIGLFYLARTP